MSTYLDAAIDKCKELGGKVRRICSPDKNRPLAIVRYNSDEGVFLLIGGDAPVCLDIKGQEKFVVKCAREMITDDLLFTATRDSAWYEKSTVQWNFISRFEVGWPG